MNEEKIKEAFTKAKQDIFNLHSDIQSLKLQIQELKRTLDTQTDRQSDNSTHISTENPTENIQNPTIQHINTTETSNSTENSTHNTPLEAVIRPNSIISTGNEGVSTDRQTDQQTDNSTGNEGVKVRLTPETPIKADKIDNMRRVSEVINSLDDIKKELRFKVKKLTNQEMTVFSIIYQLIEENIIVEYNILAQKLDLTESSIRDYVQRIIKKGLPIHKTKENNKKILLSISPELRKIASLSTIMQLRGL
jgi:DNA-binding MarR family transcriptional regulator